MDYWTLYDDRTCRCLDWRLTAFDAWAAADESRNPYSTPYCFRGMSTYSVLDSNNFLTRDLVLASCSVGQGSALEAGACWSLEQSSSHVLAVALLRLVEPLDLVLLKSAGLSPYHSSLKALLNNVSMIDICEETRMPDLVAPLVSEESTRGAQRNTVVQDPGTLFGLAIFR
jgi:hypothetical protein